MSYKTYIPLFIFITAALSLYADDVRFVAEAKSTVYVGERFNITYTLNEQGTGFRGPQISGFNVISGPNQSSSTSMQIIQGQMTRSVTLSYTYVVQAVREGSFTIPPASITVNGKTYTSNALDINVVQGRGQAPQQQQQQQQQQERAQQRTQETHEEIFLRAYANKTNPYQGEQVIVTYKIYTSLPVSQYTIDRLASYAGFWSENLTKERATPRQTTEVINGVNYTVAEIRKIALFPQRSGQLTVAPLEVECVVQRRIQRQRQSIFDDFFHNPFFDRQQVRMTIKSNPLTINVKPLPSQNRTAEFKGSVGNFNMSVDIDKTDVEVNEAVNLTVRISGSGNLSMLEEPHVSFPPNLETYDAKISDNINRGAGGVSGSRTFEYLMIPRSAGQFDISPVLFSFFNPTTQTYELLQSEPLTINVAKGDGTMPSGPHVSMVTREDVQYIGSDIRYIKNNIFPLKTLGKTFYGSWLFRILFILPFLLFVVFVIIWRRRIKMARNTVLMRNKKATKMAKKRLKQAAAFLKENQLENFYDEVSKAMWGYFNYKFNVPYADLSKEALVNTFANHNVDTELANEFVNTLDECEFARFAPGDKKHAMEKTYQQALSVITKIEKALK